MKILCFGSLNIDHVYTVESIVRPGETVSAMGLRFFPGGKGLNQAIALAKAGGDVYMAGMTGEDGGLLLEALDEAGVDTRFVGTAEGPSGHAVIQVDRAGRNSIIIYGGANQGITPGYAERVMGNFQKGDIIVLQNEINCIPEIMERAEAAGLFTVINPSPITPGLSGYPLHLADLFFVNETEGAKLTGESEPLRMLSAMGGKYPRARVVLTLGGDGAYYGYGGELIYQPVYEAHAVDTTGAGDTFTGYFTAAAARGETPGNALKLAACAAAIAITRPGAAVSIPLLREVMENL